MSEFNTDSSTLVEERPRREPHPVNEQAEAELKEARAAASYGAQIVLDPASVAAVAARGGAAGTIEENTMIRDAAMAEELAHG